MMTCRRFFTAGVSDTVFSTLFALLVACGTAPTTKATPESELAASLQKLLGHSSVAVTMKYAHLAPDFMRDEIARLRFANGQRPKWRTWPYV